MEAAEQPAAEDVLSAFKTIDETGRSQHARVLDYWLSVRGDREFPPLHDLDPLEMSDAGPSGVLLELIGGGEDAEIRHLGETLKTDVVVERIADAPKPSILACIAKKLSIVAISRNVLAFEDEFPAADGTVRCWVTLLPMNSAGPWVDYVYAFVTFATVPADAEAEPEPEPEAKADGEPEATPQGAPPVEVLPNDVEETTAIPPIRSQATDSAIDEVAADSEAAEEANAEVPPEPAAAAAGDGPGFSQMLHDPATADGFYGVPTVKLAQPRRPAPAPGQQSPAPTGAAPPAGGDADSPLQARLAAVRAKAEEARMAKIRSNTALYEGLGAAYDFALDAEDSPEEYLKLVESQGLKIQLRSPMLPVMKLAFDGMCDEPTIARLEAVLAWALKQELPRGTLAERIEAEGGLSRIVDGKASA
jgi:hypothetical protein